jgi:hypothetical protein
MNEVKTPWTSTKLYFLSVLKCLLCMRVEMPPLYAWVDPDQINFRFKL